MKFTKSLLETALGLRTHKIADHSPKGNYVAEANSVKDGHAWQAAEHLKAAEKHPKNSKQWHAAMAAHHESKAEYYHAAKLPTLADKHGDKAEEHLEKMHEEEVIEESMLAEDKVTIVHKGEGGHHRITVGTIKAGPYAGKHFVDAKFDTSKDPHKPSGHGSSQNLANYVHSKHGDGTAERRSKLHNALVAAHKTGDKKKVLDAVKAHGYSHHGWQLHESEQIDEAVSSYASKEAAAAVADKLKEKHNDQGWGHAKKPDGRWYVTHADHSRVDIKRHIGKLMEEEELEEAKKEGGYKGSLQHHELPSKVKTAVKKIHKVLEKHKVQGAHVSVAHHDYKPAHERQSAGHHEINIQVGRHHIDNERLINDLHATQPHKWTHKKGDIAISPCASIHPSPAHNIHKHLVEDVEIDAEAVLDEARYSLRRGESHGRHYRDEHGVVWDDEGYNSAGTGPSDRRERAMFSHKKPAAKKHFHEVPYKDKEHAKSEGMKWDGDKRKWYHTDAGKSATSKFKKLTEEESLEEAQSLESLRRMHRDEHENGGGTDASWAKMHAIRALVKKYHGKAAHDKMVKDTDDYAAHGGSGPARLKEEDLNEDGIYVGSRVAKKGLLGRTKYGTATPAHRDHHTIKWDNGSTSTEHKDKLTALKSTQKGYWDNKGGPPKHLQGKLKEEVLGEEEKKGGFDHRKAAMAGVMHSDDAPHMKPNMQHDFYSSKNGDKIQGTVHTVTKDRVVMQANKQHHKDHGKFHTFKFAKSYDRMNEETDLDEASEQAKINKRTKNLIDTVRGSKYNLMSKTPMKPEDTGHKTQQQTNKAIGRGLRNEEEESLDESKVVGHRFVVTVSDPGHTSVSKRDEKVQKFINVKKTSDKTMAQATARAFYRKQGLKLHDIEHHSELHEEFDILSEEHATREQAEKRMSEIEKKHPMAKHTVMQGRRSGKWHVVRHTSGGMHVIEGVEELEELSKATLGKYVMHATQSYADHSTAKAKASDDANTAQRMTHNASPEVKKAVGDAQDKLNASSYHHALKGQKRGMGIHRAIKRLTKEDCGLESKTDFNSKRNITLGKDGLDPKNPATFSAGSKHLADFNSKKKASSIVKSVVKQKKETK